MIDKSIFKNLKPNSNKLKNYGFKQCKNDFVFKTKICKNNFIAIFTIKNLNETLIDVVEADTNEKLDLFYVPSATGSFICEINAECEQIANDIATKCFEKNVFKSADAAKVIEYVKNKYDDELEYLWDKLPDCAICRRKDNKKWYCAIMSIAKNKIIPSAKGMVEIIDLRVDKEQVANVVDNKLVFPGYHMNKKSWITICLDGKMKAKDLFKYIDESYILAGRAK